MAISQNTRTMPAVPTNPDGVRNISAVLTDNGGLLTCILDRAQCLLTQPADAPDHIATVEYFGLAEMDEETRDDMVAALREAMQRHRPHRLATA